MTASPSARMGVLLAMRRLGDPEIARFLRMPIRGWCSKLPGRSTTCRSGRRCRACGDFGLAGIAVSAVAADLGATSGWAGPRTPRGWPRFLSTRICRRRAARWRWSYWRGGPLRRGATRWWVSGGRFRLGRLSRRAAAIGPRLARTSCVVDRNACKPPQSMLRLRCKSRRPAARWPRLAGEVELARLDPGRSAQGARPTERSPPVEAAPRAPGLARLAESDCGPRCSPGSIPPRRSPR